MEELLTKKNITLNLASANEHVGDIERFIRTIKERVRATFSRLPYKKYIPKLIISHLLGNAMTWLNSFPPTSGISDTISPRTLMTGVRMDFNKHCWIEFGAYAQTHEEDEPRNSMKNRTLGAISLGPSYNLQCGYNFMSLKTGKIINRNHFTPLPMPD